MVNKLRVMNSVNSHQSSAYQFSKVSPTNSTSAATTKLIKVKLFDNLVQHYKLNLSAVIQSAIPEGYHLWKDNVVESILYFILAIDFGILGTILWQIIFAHVPLILNSALKGEVFIVVFETTSLNFQQSLFCLAVSSPMILWNGCPHPSLAEGRAGCPAHN